MSKNVVHINDTALLTVGELITELCRWPDQATIRLRCPDTGAKLSVARIDSLRIPLSISS